MNNKFSELLLLSESLGKILVVDSIKENSRNTLKKFGFNESDIISVDSYGTKSDDNHYNKRLKDYLTEVDSSKISLRGIFADIISGPKNAVSEIKPLFQKNLLVNNSILALTICLRGCRAINFGRFYPNLIRCANLNNYKLKPIPLSDKFRLKTNKKSVYKIPQNMSDNASYGKTGRTATCFFKVNKLCF